MRIFIKKHHLAIFIPLLMGALLPAGNGAPSNSSENTATAHESENEALCTYKECLKPDKPPQAVDHRVHFIVRGNNGSISTNDSHLPLDYLWRIVCPSDHSMFVIIKQMSIARGEYLQVKNRKLEGCIEFWKGYHFNKKSILTAISVKPHTTSNISSPFPTTNDSSFELSYICTKKAFTYYAERFFLYSDTLNLFKENKELFFKAVKLVTETDYLPMNSNDEDVIKLLEIALSPVPYPPAQDDLQDCDREDPDTIEHSHDEESMDRSGSAESGSSETPEDSDYEEANSNDSETKADSTPHQE